MANDHASAVEKEELDDKEILFPELTIEGYDILDNPDVPADNPSYTKLVHLRGTTKNQTRIYMDVVNKTTLARNEANGTNDPYKSWDETIENSPNWECKRMVQAGCTYKFAVCALRSADKEITVTVPQEACVCKEYNLIWGNKVDCAFRKKVVEICKELWADDWLNMANNLMAVMAWETGEKFKADVPNQANSGGTGLIQFMPDTAESLLDKKVTIETTSDYWGKTLKRVKEFAEMTEIEQLDYVKQYFMPKKGKKLEFVDFYLQVLFPASSELEDHIVFADSLAKLTTRTNESSDRRNKRVRAYSGNSGLDTNKDGVIWKSEIKEKVQTYITNGEKNRATTFACMATGGSSAASSNISDMPPTLTITTTSGNETVHSGGSEEVIITVDAHGVGDASNIKVTILGLAGERDPGSWEETPAKWQGSDMRYTASPRSGAPNQWYWIPQTPEAWDGKEVKIIAQNTLNNRYSNAEYVKVEGETTTNEFGLVQVTKLGNPYIVNHDNEDTYIYEKLDGTNSNNAKHGDDWMKPDKANALSNAIYNLVNEYPNQKIVLNDCSAYNPSYNLGHAANGAHSKGEAFDCKFLTTNGNGINDISKLTADDIKINARFVEILKATGKFSTFYSDNGKIPGSTHVSGHKDHLHGN